MAMMAKMRSLAPWFIITVGGLFVLFMVLSDSKVLDFVQQQSQYVGSIDGEDITYQDYSNLVERARKNQQNATGQDIDESQMDYFRDQVWDALVTQKLMAKKIKDFGIVVTDEEIRESILGPNPPADLRQQFVDSTGNFNRQLYEQALSDPRNKEIVLMVEDRMREELIQKKLQDYLFASVVISDSELKDKFIEQNIKMKSDYLLVDIATMPDSSVQISDDELQKYYDDNLDQYKIEAQRKIKYVLFNKQPSKDDTLLVEKNLQALVDKLKTDTTSFKSYVSIYSEQPYSMDTVNLTTIPPTARDMIQGASKGQLVGPVQTFEGFAVYKLDDIVKSKDEIVRASHILVPTTGDDKADLQKAMDIYNELIKGADFAATAAAKSTDRGSAVNGGDLGWFGKGQMVKPFEDACYSGKIGVVQKPVKSNFGYHIIKVTGRSDRKYIIEKIVNKIQVSATTQDKLYTNAQDLAYLGKENGLESEVKMMKYNLVETPAFTEEAVAIPGLGSNKAIVKFAFENSIGTVSDVYRVAAGYAVVVVSDEIKPGFKPFDEVKMAIRNTLLRTKKLEKAAELIALMRPQVVNGDMNAARSVWGAVRIDSTAEFTSSGNIPGIGREYAFSDYSLEGKLNEWSQPIKGTRGAYLINVKYRTQYNATLFDFQKNAIRKDLLQQRKNTYFSAWLQDLKKESKVVDNRYLFYAR